MSLPQNTETIINVLAALSENAAPTVQDVLDDALERIQYFRYRNRERDFESVLRAIRTGAATARDIATETSISLGHTCYLLRRLVRQQKIGYNLRATKEPGRPQRLYFLREQQPRKNKPAL